MQKEEKADSFQSLRVMVLVHDVGTDTFWTYIGKTCP